MFQQLGNCYCSCSHKFSFHSVCCHSGYSCSGLSKRSTRLLHCKFQWTSISLPRTTTALGWNCFNNNSCGDDRSVLLPKAWTYLSEGQNGICVSALVFGWSGSTTLHCFTCPLHIYRCNNRPFLCHWHRNLLWNFLLFASLIFDANLRRSWPLFTKWPTYFSSTSWPMWSRRTKYPTKFCPTRPQTCSAWICCPLQLQGNDSSVFSFLCHGLLPDTDNNVLHLHPHQQLCWECTITFILNPTSCQCTSCFIACIQNCLRITRYTLTFSNE